MTNGVRDRWAFALDEIELETHRAERQQQIGKENRGVDLDRLDRLQRDGDREVGVTADVEQRIALPQRSILRHVPAGLTHEPDRRGVDGLLSAGFEKTIVHAETMVFARVSRSSSHIGLNLRAAPSALISIWSGSGRK